MGRSILSILSRSARARGVVGLTLHPTHIALAHVASAPDRPARLLACQSQDIGSAARQAEALKSLVRSARLAGMPCVLTLEQGAYSLLQIERPPVEAEELRQAARWRIKDLIDFPVDEAVVDVFEVPGLDSRGRAPSLYVAAARRAELARRVALIKAAGLKLEKINISELALRNLAALLAEGEESLALLHLAEHRGMIAVVRAGALYVARALDYGLAHLQALAAAAGAEEIDAAAARQEAYDRIALEVQRTLDYYDSYFGQPPARRLYVLPAETTDLQELVRYARSSLGLESLMPDLRELLAAPEALSGEPLAGCALAAAGAVDETAL